MLTGIQRRRRRPAGCMAALGTSALGALGVIARSWGSDVCGDLLLSLCWRTWGRGRQLGAGRWVAGAGNTCQAGSFPSLVPQMAEPNGPTEQIPWSHGWQTGTGWARPGGAGGGGSPERRTLRPPGRSGWGGPGLPEAGSGHPLDPRAPHLGHWGSQALQAPGLCLQTRRGVCPSARGRGQGPGPACQRSPKLERVSHGPLGTL